LGARGNDYAASVAVEAMHEARDFAVRLGEGGEQRFERARDARAALNRQTRRLVENEHVRVFVDKHGADFSDFNRAQHQGFFRNTKLQSRRSLPNAESTSSAGEPRKSSASKNKRLQPS